MMTASLQNIRCAPWPDAPAAAGEEALRVHYVSEADGQPDWAVLMPGRSTHAFAVMLHGHGSGGDQLLTRPDIRDQWLPAMRSAGLGILCPNLRGNAWMSPAAAADLHQLLAWLGEQYAPQRIVLVGGSMGGTSTLIYAALHPQTIDGVVALCPATDLPGYWRWAATRASQHPILAQIAAAIEEHYGATPEHAPELFARHSALQQYNRLTMPIALAHGSADATIPVEGSRQLAARLGGRAEVRYQEVPDGDHDAPLVTFPDALRWVLERGMTKLVPV